MDKAVSDLMRDENVAIVEETLLFFLYECCLDDGPDIETVTVWCNILRRRGKKFIRLVNLCETWLEEMS